MSKRVLTIVIAAGVALLLGVLLLIVSALPESSKGDNSSLVASSGITSSEEEKDVNGYIAVYAYDEDQLRRAEVKNQVGGYTVNYVKEDTYSVEGVEEFDLNSDSIDNLITCSMQIYATKTIAENPTDLATYGLDEPVAEIKLSYDTGETIEMLIGDLSPSGGKYVLVKNNNKIYTVSTNWTNVFEYKYTHFLDMTVTDPLETDEDGNEIEVRVKKLTFNGGGLKRPIILVENPEYLAEVDRLENASSDEELDVTVNAAQYIFQSPFVADADNNVYAGKQHDYFGVLAEDIYTPHPTATDIANCGLSSPYATVEYVTSKETVKISLGKSFEIDGEKYYYALSSQRKALFVVNASDFSFFEEDMIDYISPIVVNVMIDEFATMTAEYDGKKQVFEMSGEDDELVVRWNGKKMSTKEFRDLYQLVMLALCEESVEPDTYSGDPDLKITYTYRGKERVDTVEYVKVGTRKYMIRKNGSDLALCRSKHVDALISGIEKFVTGLDVPAAY
ncbi:MAG: DUF4340 domain-containing protein [Oscillospiraceae bacterium]|nr:DUF4340 domain-containing protein [Oscillospiraceae bacterium]